MYRIYILCEDRYKYTSGFWPPVRAPVFFNSLPSQTGRCAPLAAHRSFAASYSALKNIYNLSNLGRPRQGLFSFPGPERLWGPLPPVPPLPAIFWGQKYIPLRPYALIFSAILFFSCWIFSFRYFLFCLSPFQFLLILLFLSLFILSCRAIIRLLILLLLYFQLFVV
jgi:hypothetical protein